MCIPLAVYLRKVCLHMGTERSLQPRQDKSKTFLELAEEVLEQEGKPLKPKEIWEKVKEKGYNIETKSKKPEQTLYGALYNDTKNPNSKFIRVALRPTRFGLKDKVYQNEDPESEGEDFYKEVDLYPFLTYYVYSFYDIRTKQILHQKASKRGYSQWLFPDMVGVWFPQNIKNEVLCVAEKVGVFPVRLYSYEVKKQLNFDNIRSAFFQAVSNSSWAHQGYLVAETIDSDPEFMVELRRLSASFGIGIIRLDTEDPDNSEILIPAKEKEEVDITTMNVLAEKSPEFREFLKLVCQYEKTNLAFDEVPDREKLSKK